MHPLLWRGESASQTRYSSFFLEEIFMLENRFKTNLVRELKERFPGCIVLHIDPNEIQGIPDLLILYRDRWAALEGKRSLNAPHRPNQDYYVNLMNQMSYAAFICPENKEEILNDLQRSFASERTTRFS
nr:MAG TPA: Nuclease [Caudoviricetes sp.]